MTDFYFSQSIIIYYLIADIPELPLYQKISQIMKAESHFVFNRFILKLRSNPLWLSLFIILSNFE